MENGNDGKKKMELQDQTKKYKNIGKSLASLS